MVFVRGIDESHILVIPTNLDLIPSALVRHVMRDVLSETPYGVENFVAKVRVN